MPAPITRLTSSDGAASGASYYGSCSWEVPASNVSEAASGGSRSFHNLVQGSPDNGQDTGIVEGPYGGLCRCIRQLGFEDSLGLRLTGVAYSRCVRQNLAPHPRSWNDTRQEQARYAEKAVSADQLEYYEISSLATVAYRSCSWRVSWQRCCPIQHSA